MKYTKNAAFTAPAGYQKADTNSLTKSIAARCASFIPGTEVKFYDFDNNDELNELIYERTFTLNGETHSTPGVLCEVNGTQTIADIVKVVAFVKAYNLSDILEEIKDDANYDIIRKVAATSTYRDVLQLLKGKTIVFNKRTALDLYDYRKNDGSTYQRPYFLYYEK